jgi:hypothetical protein
MKDLVSKLLSNKVVEARSLLDAKINDLFNQKLDEIKLKIASDLFEDYELECYLDESTEQRANVQKVGRARIIKFRVRKGVVQRRKKFSAVKGWTIRHGQLTRMMPAERRNRRIGSLRSKAKRRAELPKTLRKRRISIRKRRSVGL